MPGIALLALAALAAATEQCMTTSDGQSMNALSVAPERDGTCLHLFHNPQDEDGDLKCSYDNPHFPCGEQGYFHKLRVGAHRTPAAARAGWGDVDATCCDKAVLDSLRVMLEKLKRYFSACENCRTVWAHMLCAANCRHDQARMILPANATLGRPTAMLRITQSLCDLIWHACSDDGGFSGRAFFYERNYDQGRQRAGRRLFCEANLFDRAPLERRLALAHCANTTREGVHAGDVMNASSVRNEDCTARPMGITVVQDADDCVVPATDSSPPRYSCLGTQLLADMQGVPRGGAGVTTVRWTVLPGSAEYTIETKLPRNSKIAGYDGGDIESGGFADGQWRRFNHFANFCSSSYSLGAGSIFLFLVVLFCAAALTNTLHQYHLYWLPESVVYMIIGIVVGFLARDAAFMESMNMQPANASDLGFNQKLFMFVLLPPIIFNSGYSLRTKNMASSIGTILTFAVFGTIICTLIVAFFIWAFRVFTFLPFVTEGAYPKLDWAESLMFGALISAVDPVATLGIFNALKVDPVLEALVCGESLINDAVAIILFSSVKQYVLTEAPGADIDELEAVGEASVRFIALSCGSLGIGLLMGCFSALFFKLFSFRNNPGMEIVVFFIFAYGSFVMAELPFLHCSGILSTLTCGVIMATYTQHNMSAGGVVQTGNISAMLCTFADMLVFMMTGAAMAINVNSISWGFTALVVVLIFFSRAVAVYGLSAVLNFRRKKPLVARNHQHMLWFAGLRGAIAVGLTTELPSKYRHEMSAATCVIVFITVILMGSSTPTMLKKLKVDTGVLFALKTDEDDNIGMKTFYMLDDYLIRPLLMSRPDFRVKGHVFVSIALTRAEGLPKMKSTLELLYPRAFGTVMCNGDVLAQSQPAERGPSPTYHDCHAMLKLPIGREAEFLQFTKIKLNIWCRSHRLARPTSLGHVSIDGASLVPLLEHINPPSKSCPELSGTLVEDPDILREKTEQREKFKRMRHKMLGLAPERASADGAYMELTEQAATEIAEEEGEGAAGAEQGGAEAAEARRGRKAKFPLVRAAVRLGQCVGKRCGDGVQATEEGMEDVLDKATLQAVSGKVYYKVTMEQPDLHDKGRILALAKGWLTVTRELARTVAKATGKAATAVGKEAQRQAKNAPQNARDLGAASKRAGAAVTGAARRISSSSPSKKAGGGAGGGAKKSTDSSASTVVSSKLAGREKTGTKVVV